VIFLLKSKMVFKRQSDVEGVEGDYLVVTSRGGSRKGVETNVFRVVNGEPDLRNPIVTMYADKPRKGREDHRNACKTTTSPFIDLSMLLHPLYCSNL
jgi:hypothetical protein